MEYTLAGCAVLTTIRPTFGVPFFSRHGTNHTFAQELDENFNIVSFEPFDPSNYSRLHTRGPMIRLREGEPGLLAFVGADSAVITGTKDEVAELVRGMRLLDSSPPFFAVEAAALVGEVELREAQVRASAHFKNSEAGQRWLQREQAALGSSRVISTQRAKPPVDAELRKAITDLRDNPDSPEWHKIWFRAWLDWTGNAELVELAVWWLDLPKPLRRREGRVMAALIRHNTTAPSIAEFALKWLFTRMDPLAPDWADVWLSLSKRIGVITPVAEAGRAYLAKAFEEEEYFRTFDALPKGKRLLSYWTAVWARLWRGSRRDVRLFNLAKQYVEDDRPITSQFVEGVLLPLLRNDETQTWASQFLLEWLYDTRAETILWTKVYRSILQLRPGDERLLEHGMDFLADGYPNLRTWPKVWNDVSAQLSAELKWTMAERWLLRTDMRMSVWADVLVQVLEHSGFSDEASLRGKAIQWMRLNIEHPNKDRIATFAQANRVVT
jgi:hypothetical protein